MFFVILFKILILIVIWSDETNTFNTMKKIRAAVVGYGNIGKFAVEAIEAAADFELAGIVRRAGAENCPAEIACYEVVDSITKLKDVDVAILATPTRSVEQYAKEVLGMVHPNPDQYRMIDIE